MRITVEIPDERLSDVLDCAPQACRSWAYCSRGAGVHSLTVREPAGAGDYFTFELERGLKTLASKYPNRFSELLSDEHWDELTVSALVQAACFGEVRFG